MAVGQIIGKVAVKVLPDTSDFRSDAKVKLDKVEKSLGKINVAAAFDDRGLRTEILKSLRALNADMKTKDIYKVKFRAAISQDGMAGELRKAVREMNARAKAAGKVKVKIDAAAAIVDAELSKASLRRVKQQLDDFRRDNSPIKVMVHPEMAAGFGTVVAARLAFLTRPRIVPIIPVLEPGAMSSVGTALAAMSGARVLSDVFDDIWSSLKRLDKSVPIIGTMAEAIAGLSGWALSASSNLFALSASLAQIGGAGLALPGIFGGIAIGLGASFAVLKDFNKVLPEVQKKFARLQDQMSKNFWKVAEAPIRNLINSLFPQLQKSLGETATQLGGFFGNLANSLRTTLGPVLGGMFENLNSSIEIFAGKTDAIAGIITTLGQVGSGQLERLAEWVGKLITDFDGWLSAAAEDGRLTQWVDNGIFAIKELGRALGNIGGILNGLSDAALAAGGSTLTMFADTLQRVEDTVKGANFQKNLTDVLTAAHQAMSNISDKAGPAFESFMTRLSQVLTTILPQAGDTIGTALDAIFKALAQPEVADGLVSMFDGLHNAVVALAPAMGPLAKALGSLGPVIGALAENIAGGLADALIVLSPIFTDIVNALMPIIEQLGPILQDTIKQLTPLLQSVGEGIVKIIEAAGPLVTKIGELIALLLPVLVPVLQFLAGVIVDTVIFAIGALINIVDGIIKVFSGVIQFFQAVFNNQWGQAWEAVKRIASGVWSIIKGAFKLFLTVGLGKVLQLGGKLLKGIWGKAWDVIKKVASEVWSSIKGRFAQFMTDLKNAPTKALAALKSLFKGAWGDIKAGVQLLWESLPKIFRSGVTKVVNFVKGIPGKILAVFTGAKDLLVNAGKSIIDGFINGIGSKIGAVKDKLQGLTKKLTSWKGPESVDRKLLYKAGVLVMEGFIKGLQSRFDKVKKTLEGLTGDIPQHASKRLKDMVNDSRTKLLSLMGKWDAITEKIKDKLNEVKQAAIDYGKQVKDALVALGDPTGLEDQSFSGIVSNLQAAIEKATKFTAVLKTLKGLGLNSTTMFQLINAGPDAALAAAESIAAAGQAGVDELNKLQDELGKAAGQAGKLAEQLMFENGMNMAKGLLKGLRDQRKELEAEMKSIAKAMVKVIKTELGIHSPSRVFRKLFSYVPQGAVLGVRDGIGDVEKAMQDLGSAQPAVNSRFRGQIGRGLNGGTTNNRTINYYAAPGSSVSSQDDLFAAVNRARMVGF